MYQLPYELNASVFYNARQGYPLRDTLGFSGLVALVKPQVWVWLASLTAAGLAVVAALSAKPRWAGVGAIAAVACWIIARRWNQRTPAPFPFALRALLDLPRPCQSPKRLKRLLEPRHGERLLEIGPGVGVHALPVASSLAPDGVLEVLDIQPSMLEEVARRAREARVENIAPRQADAAHLPYPDQTFDGAYMIGTLGEIADGDGALRELFRVLKSNGRLVVGEAVVDPDYVPLRSLQRRTAQAGLVFVRKTVGPFAYLARFERRPKAELR